MVGLSAICGGTVCNIVVGLFCNSHGLFCETINWIIKKILHPRHVNWSNENELELGMSTEGRGQVDV